MKEYFFVHLKYYITLLCMLVLGIILLLRLGDNRQLQIAVILMLALGYIVWGILHHYIHHDLTWKITLEYILFGVFGVIVCLLYFK